MKCVVFLFACSIVLTFVYAEEPEKAGAANKKDALDQLLTDFAAASAKLDIEKAEKLFVSPDDTPAGKNRQGHLSELRKDWKRAKEGGANEGPSVQFKNTTKLRLFAPKCISAVWVAPKRATSAKLNSPWYSQRTVGGSFR